MLRYSIVVFVQYIRFLRENIYKNGTNNHFDIIMLSAFRFNLNFRYDAISINSQILPLACFEKNKKIN